MFLVLNDNQRFSFWGLVSIFHKHIYSSFYVGFLIIDKQQMIRLTHIWSSPWSLAAQARSTIAIVSRKWIDFFLACYNVILVWGSSAYSHWRRMVFLFNCCIIILFKNLVLRVHPSLNVLSSKKTNILAAIVKRYKFLKGSTGHLNGPTSCDRRRFPIFWPNHYLELGARGIWCHVCSPQWKFKVFDSVSWGRGRTVGGSRSLCSSKLQNQTIATWL